MEEAIQEIQYLIQGIEINIQRNLSDVKRSLEYIQREQQTLSDYQDNYTKNLRRMASLKQALLLLEKPRTTT